MADFFASGTIVRRVGREPAIMFGAGRALLLQLAHPAVAQGVHDHSDFKRNPFTRLQGTLEATFAVVFGSEELALGVGRRIRRIHDYVTGPTYRANDPANLLWVHATLVDTALGCYRDLVGPLSPHEVDRYYAQMMRVAEVFGVPLDEQPPDHAAFRTYFDDTVASLAVTDVGRDLGQFILHPQLPGRLDVPFAPLLALQRLFTVATLPPTLRDQYGFTWSDDSQARYERIRRALYALNRRTPRAVRIAPNVASTAVLLRQAERHVREFDADDAARRARRDAA